MNTTRFVPLSLAALTFFLVSCTGAAAPAATATPMPPMPSNTPMPDMTVAPTNTPVPGGSAIVDVTIKNFAFNPPSITVKVGTTVRWTNQDSASHSVTSDTGLWDSGNVAQGATYSRVFDTVGTFAYHCGIHPSMKGTVIVTS